MHVSIRSCLWGWFNHVHSKLFPQVGCSLHHDKEMLHYDWSQGRFGRTLPAMRWPPSRKIEGHTRIRFTIYTWSPTTTLCHTLLRDEFQFNETSQFVSAGGWEKNASNYHQITMAILFLAWSLQSRFLQLCSRMMVTPKPQILRKWLGLRYIPF